MPPRNDFNREGVVSFYREFLRSMGYDSSLEDELDETDEETDVEEDEEEEDGDVIPEGHLIETDDESGWDSDEDELPSMEDISNSVN